MKNLIVALAIVLFVSCQKDNKTEEQPEKTVEPPLIAEHKDKCAFNPDNIELQFFTIDANKGGTVKGKNGTKLIIPGNAFIATDGKPVTGKITIGMKEALSMSDILFGGLTTTSDGKMLSTGGMLYIEAKQGDEKLELTGSKAISISVPTDAYNPEMLIFTGEQDVNGNINWVNPVDVIEKEKNTVKKQVTDVLLAEYDEPVPPVKPVKNTGGFTVKVNLSNPELLPEFAPFKNVEWKLIDEATYSNEDSQRIWKYVGVERSEKAGIYILTLKGVEGDKNKMKKYDVIPVFEGKDYEKAIASYNEKFTAFENEKNKREVEQKAMQERYERTNKAKDYADSYVFETQKLGWINCDYFYNDKTASEVIVKATVTNDGKDNIYTYLILKKDRVCVPGYLNDNGDFVFDNGINTKFKMPLGISVIIVAVSGDKDGKLGFASQEVKIKKETSVALELKTSTKEQLRKKLQMDVDL